MKILGVDFGPRRTGLAISDENEKLALAYGVVPGTIEAIAAAVRESGAGAVVVGLPLNMDGTEGSAARRVRRVVRELRERTGLAVDTVDERLTSYEAERRLADVPLSRAKKRAHTNVVAAQIILDAYLQSRRK